LSKLPASWKSRAPSNRVVLIWYLSLLLRDFLFSFAYYCLFFNRLPEASSISRWMVPGVNRQPVEMYRCTSTICSEYSGCTDYAVLLFWTYAVALDSCVRGEVWLCLSCISAFRLAYAGRNRRQHRCRRADARPTTAKGRSSGFRKAVQRNWWKRWRAGWNGRRSTLRSPLHGESQAFSMD